MTTNAAAGTNTHTPNDDSRSLLKLGFWMAVMLVALDQFSKYVVDLIIGPERSRSDYWIIEEHLGFDYVRNAGIAFGINLGSERMTTAIVTLAFVAVTVIFWKMAPKDNVTAVGAGLLIGGAIGNLIDRVRFNAVVDFIAVGPLAPVSISPILPSSSASFSWPGAQVSVSATSQPMRRRRNSETFQ